MKIKKILVNATCMVKSFGSQYWKRENTYIYFAELTIQDLKNNLAINLELNDEF